MKKKKLQKLSLEKFKISRLNTKSSDRVIGGNTISLAHQSAQLNCHTNPILCPIEDNTIHVDIITDVCALTAN